MSVNLRHMPKGYRFDAVRRIGRIDAGSIRAVLNFVIPRLETEPPPTEPMEGFGIVTCAGGRYLRYLYAQVKVTRRFTDAPIHCYHLGPAELNHPCVDMLREMDVTFVDAIPVMREQNYALWKNVGWSAKSAALLDCPFRYALFMDADCIPLIDPESLLDSDDFTEGFLAWHDINKCRKNNMVFPLMGLKMPKDFREFEAGQQLWDRQRHWKALQLFSWMNGRPRPFYELVHGDKDLGPLSFMKLGIPFNVGGEPKWEHNAIRHHLSDGTPAFLHYMETKRSKGAPPEVASLLHEFDNLTLQPA